MSRGSIYVTLLFIYAIIFSGLSIPSCEAAILWDMAALKSAPAVTITSETTETVNAVNVTVREVKYIIPVDSGHLSIFAYYAFPTNRGGVKIPGMVLVHGGGGIADKSWATNWASRGFGAIAMDLPGKGSGRDASRSEGPDMSNATIFNVSPSQKSSYLYSAVITASQAISFLANQAEIDSTKIGMQGRSWGGVITQLVNGIDDRLAAACTVFGTGYIPDDSVWVNQGCTTLNWTGWQSWRQHYDPSSYLNSEHARTLYIDATNDMPFPIRSFVKTYEGAKCEKTICFALNKNHADDDASTTTTNRWFEFTLKSGVALPAVSTTLNGNVLHVSQIGSQPVTSLALATANIADLPNAVWTSMNIARDADGTWYVNLPTSNVACILIARDATGASTSSYIHLPSVVEAPKQCIDWINYNTIIGWNAVPVADGPYVSVCPNTGSSNTPIYAALSTGGIDAFEYVAGVGYVAYPILRGTKYSDICESYMTPGSLYGARADGGGIDYVSWNPNMWQWSAATLVPYNYVSAAAMSDVNRSGCIGALAAGGIDWLNWMSGAWQSTRLIDGKYVDICADPISLGCTYGVNSSGGIDAINWAGNWRSVHLVSGNYLSVATNTYTGNGGCYAAKTSGGVDWIHDSSGWIATPLVSGAVYTDICGDGITNSGKIYGLTKYSADISREKKRANGEDSQFKGTVTAAFANYFYVENADRTCGIRVQKSGYQTTIGNTVDVRGNLTTLLDTGERCISASYVAQSAGSAIPPVYMNIKSLGGGNFGNPSVGQGQIGVTGGTGLNNIGLLVKVSGKVKSTNGTDTIFIDDGSGITLEVYDPYSSVGNSVFTDDYVQITGISQCKKNGTDTLRKLLLVDCMH